jgi:hypothetical protein
MVRLGGLGHAFHWEDLPMTLDCTAPGDVLKVIADNGVPMGDVFAPDVTETDLDYKPTNEVDELRRRPHSYEFFLYYDI